MPTMTILVDNTIPVAADFNGNFSALNQAIGTTTTITGYTTGDMLYASGATALAKRAIGATGQGLVTSGGLPTWAYLSIPFPFHWNAGNTGPPGGTTNFMGGGIVDTTVEANMQLPLPFACTVGNLYAAASTAPTAGQTFTYTLRKNGVDTAVTCQIANTATSANDVANTVAFAAGDLITLKVVTSASAVAAAHNAAVRLIPA